MPDQVIESQSQVQYRPIAGFPGYRVGDDGSVWSCWKNGGNDRTGQVMTDVWHRLKGWVDKRRGKNDGYIKIGLMRQGRLYRLRLHRIVLESFRGLCPIGMQSRHLDDVKSNNKLSNLVWGTRQDNSDDIDRNGLRKRGEEKRNAKLFDYQIREIRALLSNGETERFVAALFSVNRTTIRSIKNGKTWTHVV